MNALEGAGDQRADYWINKVTPYLRKIWPRDKKHKTPAIAECFGRLCVASGKAFPEAFDMLEDWLQPLPYMDRDFLIPQLRIANLCQQFPEPSLAFLDLVVDIKDEWPTNDLDKCLKQIQEAEPALENDERYQRLANYLRLYGRGGAPSSTGYF